VSGTLSLRNRQRARRINLRLLRRIVRALMKDLLRRPDYELGIIILTARDMALANQQHLGHEGATDVITFPYGEPADPCLAGDLLICLEVAESQARAFRTAWQEEVVRYAVHGVLHLCGYDDRGGADRRRMKAEENRLLKALRKEYDFAQLGS
jgi:probable rRNA maturation factor